MQVAQGNDNLVISIILVDLLLLLRYSSYIIGCNMSAYNKNNASEKAWIEVVQAHVESLRFGTVQVVVHESRVVQIEKTERVRFDKQESSGLHAARPNHV